ncbi:MAG: NAD kinase [Microbacteriaceae bacterium]
MMSTTRHILIVSHTGRRDSMETALKVARELRQEGVLPVLVESEYRDLTAFAPELSGTPVLGRDVAVDELELVMVLGGDGTILRAAEIVRGSAAPILGVNLGHVGFLAETEREDLVETVRRALARDYDVEERMTIDVTVTVGAEEVYRTWALNEATVEKGAGARMIEVVIEVNGLPLSSFGCDGIVMSTPTGSTAYAFSAGGPIVWPNIDAILMVPLSAHALFARPLVVAPSTVLAVELLERSPGPGILWCDGRRGTELPLGARVEVRRSGTPVLLARLQHGEFTDRLVRKFDLPVAGWRGPRRPDPAQ